MAEEQQMEQEVEEFHPKGTVAILIMFVLAIIILWGSVYVILLSRGVTV
jgi:flagellar basal body-associated protein FliL